MFFVHLREPDHVLVLVRIRVHEYVLVLERLRVREHVLVLVNVCEVKSEVKAIH